MHNFAHNSHIQPMTDPTLLTFFLQGAALGFTAALAPGPFQTYLISETLAGGWRRGAPIAFVPLITDLPIILFSLFLLNQLPENFLRVISLAGGAFVLYLAWRLWGNWRKGSDEVELDSDNTQGSFWRGAVVNLLGPGPYLFWALVSGPLLLSALRESILAGAAYLIGFYGVMILSLLGITFLFHQTRRLGPRVVHGLLLISIIILVVFGGVLLRQGIWG
jgi:threonine/homoserine/homoserine lactone efflux protein